MDECYKCKGKNLQWNYCGIGFKIPGCNKDGPHEHWLCKDCGAMFSRPVMLNTDAQPDGNDTVKRYS